MEEREDMERILGDIAQVCLPKYRIAVSYGSTQVAEVATITYRGKEGIPCFQIAKDFSHFQKDGSYENGFVPGLLDCIKELDVINPLLELSSFILNALLPLHIVLQALESGDKPSKYEDICTKCEGSISKIPEVVTELAKLYPGKDISHLGKVSTEAAEVCNSIAQRKGKDVPGERIEKLLEDIDKAGNILREMIQQVTPDTNAK